MADTQTDVLVAGYPDVDAATKDFDALVELVEGKQVEIEGVILVTHAKDGSVNVQQTGDNLGRKGAAGGGGVGLAAGSLASRVVGCSCVGSGIGRPRAGCRTIRSRATLPELPSIRQRM